MTTCPPDEIWTALLAGLLANADEAAFYQHCATCKDCQRMLGALGEPATFSSAKDPSLSPPTLLEGPMRSAEPWSPPPAFAEFRIRRPLGRGSMGQVFVGHDLVLDRPVAVKFINSLGRKEKDRFLVEARAIARLNHPNVVTLYRVGELDGRPYLVSELIPGESLDHLPVPISWLRVLEIGRDLAAGLAEAHRRGVLHRDIKPGNVLLSKSGVVKILDFGLARLSKVPVLEQQRLSHSIAPPLALSLTQPGALLGTPLYMSPEAWEGHDPIPQMDVYSVGALLYELCTGSPPHIAGHLEALRWKVLQEDSVALGAKVPDLDPEFAQVVDRCLRRDPAARFPSAVELHQALAQRIRARWGEPSSEDPTRIFPKILPVPTATALPASVAPPTTAAVAVKRLTTTPASLRAHRPDLDPRWERTILRCLEREPAARFGSAPEVSRSLEARQMGHWRRRTLVGAIVLLAVLGSSLFLSYWGVRKPAMVRIPGGTFNMGSTEEEIKSAYAWSQNLGCKDCERRLYEREQPVREVQISSFYLDASEVTNEQFAAWLNGLSGLRIGENRYVLDGNVLRVDLFPSYGYGGVVHQASRFVPRQGYELKPVAQVSWSAALRYCEAQGKRLPTEAEWEFAARGSGGARFPWGDQEPHCEDVVFGRIKGEECTSLGFGPAQVQQTPKDRSPQGVFDLGGNVAEWVMDSFRRRYPYCPSPCRDPVVTENTQEDGGPDVHVVRGGAWFRGVDATRSAGRSQRKQAEITGDIGFRCAKSVVK